MIARLFFGLWLALGVKFTVAYWLVGWVCGVDRRTTIKICVWYVTVAFAIGLLMVFLTRSRAVDRRSATVAKHELHEPRMIAELTRGVGIAGTCLCLMTSAAVGQDVAAKVPTLAPWQPLAYPRSELLEGIEFDENTRRTEARGSDIWPITWADDGHQYAAFGDGGGFGGKGNQARVSLGVARIEGGPRDYEGRNVWGGKDAESKAQFEGKGTGIVSVDGVLYMWVAGPGSLTVPRTRLAVSRDHAKTWSLAPWEWTMQDRLFAGAFVNAGRDHAAAPDEYVYACFTRLDAVPDKPRNWIHERPGRLDLARAPKARILDRDAWEWFAGVDERKQAQWTREMGKRLHAFEDPNGIKVASLCHQPALKRYLLMYNPRDPGGNFALFEAPQPWGPWKEVAYLKKVGLFMPPEETWRVSVYHFAPAWWSGDGKEFTLVFNVGDDAWNTAQGRLLVRGER